MGPRKGSRRALPRREGLDEAWLAWLHLGKFLSHHPFDDAEVSEITRRGDLVFGGHLSELNPVIGGVERLACLIFHEDDDLVAHGVVVIGMLTVTHGSLLLVSLR